MAQNSASEAVAARSSNAVATRSRMSGSELFPQLELLADSLTQSQYEAAKLFEIAYYSVSNFPELAKQVRLSAHQARTSHEFASALMKKFAVTGNQIVDTVIPLIMKTIDIGEEKVIKAYFGMIITWSENMKKEAEDTRDRYIQLTNKLQEDIELIRQRRKGNVEEKADIVLKKQHEASLCKAEQENLRKWQAEEQQNQKELEELRATRGTITQELQEGSNRGKTFMCIAMIPAIGWAAAGLGLIADIVHHKKKMEIYGKLAESLKVADDKRFRLIKEQTEAKKAAQGRLYMIQQLCLKNELLGDESSLLEAVNRLGEADKHLDKLARFWGDMAVLLTYLQNETVAGQPFLECLQNPACAVAFKETLTLANEKWVLFGEVCTHYVHRCEEHPTLSIDSLYGFLDGRVDGMNQQQRSDMITGIQQEFQSMYAAIDDVNV